MCFLSESHHFKIKTTYLDDLFPYTFKFFITVGSQSSAPQKSNWFKDVCLFASPQKAKQNLLY